MRQNKYQPLSEADALLSLLTASSRKYDYHKSLTVFPKERIEKFCVTLCFVE